MIAGVIMISSGTTLATVPLGPGVVVGVGAGGGKSGVVVLSILELVEYRLEVSKARTE